MQLLLTTSDAMAGLVARRVLAAQAASAGGSGAFKAAAAELWEAVLLMGTRDGRSRRGKIFLGSNGKVRELAPARQRWRSPQRVTCLAPLCRAGRGRPPPPPAARPQTRPARSRFPTRRRTSRRRACCQTPPQRSRDRAPAHRRLASCSQFLCNQNLEAKPKQQRELAYNQRGKHRESILQSGRAKYNRSSCGHRRCWWRRWGAAAAAAPAAATFLRRPSPAAPAAPGPGCAAPPAAVSGGGQGVALAALGVPAPSSLAGPAPAPERCSPPWLYLLQNQGVAVRHVPA